MGWQRRRGNDGHLWVCLMIPRVMIMTRLDPTTIEGDDEHHGEHDPTSSKIWSALMTVPSDCVGTVSARKEIPHRCRKRPDRRLNEL